MILWCSDSFRLSFRDYYLENFMKQLQVYYTLINIELNVILNWLWIIYILIKFVFPNCRFKIEITNCRRLPDFRELHTYYPLQPWKDVSSIFFYIMEHLHVHLLRKAAISGLVQYRWMYPFKLYTSISRIRSIF